MSEYSKGPWEIDRNSVHSGSIATVHHCLNNDWIDIWSPNWPESQEENEANARLIAVAPELLEACELILADYQQDCDGMDWNGPVPVGIKRLRAVVAKAKGES